MYIMKSKYERRMISKPECANKIEKGEKNREEKADDTKYRRTNNIRSHSTVMS